MAHITFDGQIAAIENVLKRASTREVAEALRAAIHTIEKVRNLREEIRILPSEDSDCDLAAKLIELVDLPTVEVSRRFKLAADGN